MQNENLRSKGVDVQHVVPSMECAGCLFWCEGRKQPSSVLLVDFGSVCKNR